MAVGDPQYWTTFSLVEALVHRLHAFLGGRETHESLEAWAKALWTGQASPVEGHRVATAILMNLWNAATRQPPGDESRPYVLRRIDADEYLHGLQRGDRKVAMHDLGSLRATPAEVAVRLGRETERHVLDGIGWCDYLQFASPGSGRVFLLERPLDAVASRGSWIYVDRLADPLDAARDLFETLTIDLADLDGFARDIAIDPAALPHSTLWRQDDNGNRFEVARFTGQRKAEAALRHYESLHHKQVYWLEKRP